MLWLVLAMVLQAASPIRTVGKGEMSGIETARQVTVHTAAEWAALWREHAPGRQPSQPPQAPAVDFSREMVVGVFLGTRPTPGYSVQIVRTVAPPNGGLVVEYVEAAPPRDQVTAQILTAPYHLVAVSKRDGDVRFQKVDK